MSFTVACQACGARFALPDDLFERKFKGRLVTVRCKQCGANMSVDGVELASAPRHKIPEPDADAAVEQPAPVDMTPTVPLADAATEWTVSYDYDDDRELDRDQIAGALQRGEIDADTIVWREGMEEWLPISQVPALADLLQSRQDATGGFLGTGMQLDAGKAKLEKPAPPPQPATPPPQTGTRKAPEPAHTRSLGELRAGKTAGKARALSAGTLFIDGKPARKAEPTPQVEKHDRPKLPTAPRVPVPAWKAKLKDTPAVIDDEPPSSGTPALSELTTALRPAKKAPERASADVFGIAEDPGTLLAPPAFNLAPPAIDAESPAPPELAEIAVEVEFESEPAPAPDIAHPAPRRGGVSGRTIAGIVLISGSLAFSIWWFAFRAQPSAPSQSAASTPAASSPAAPARNAAAPATAASSAPARAAPARTATARRGATHEPSAPAKKPVAEKHAAESTKESGQTGKTASKPAPPEATTEKTSKELPPFSTSAAIAALNSAAGSASSCRREGDPSGMARVVITFAPSGRVTTARVSGPPFAGTPTGGCIASHMRSARVPPFSGSFVTVSKTIVIH